MTEKKAHEHDWEIITVKVTPDNKKFNYAHQFVLKKRKCKKCAEEQTLDYYKESE